MKLMIIILSLLLIAIAIPAPAQAFDCWKGNAGTEKQGQYGTYDAEMTTVPDAIQVLCSEYEDWNRTKRMRPIPAPTLVPTPVPTPTPEPLNRIDPTQTIISGLAGAGAAIIVARRKKT